MIITAQSAVFKSPRGFIVLEGVNGAGKSTLQQWICGELTRRKIPLQSTFEPGDTEAGKLIRQIVLGSRGLSPLSELFLFAADRREHVEKVIRPALEEARLVICDRYTYSTTAFQGFGRGLGLSVIHEVNHQATGGLYPDLVLLLDLDPLEGLRRARARNSSGKDSFEQEELDFHSRLREGFLEMAKSSLEPFLILDARKDPQALCDEAMQVIEKLLESL